MLEQMNEYGKRNIPFLFILDFELQSPIILPLEEASQEEVFFNIKGFKNYIDLTTLPEFIEFEQQAIPFARYKTAFELVQKHLQYGDSFLTNLTFPSAISTNLSLRQIFEYSTAPYRLLYKDQFTFFSPEPFVTIENGVIASYPMKGTIDASLPNAAQQILADKKERAEHNTIVDLIRNDLSSVAKKVRVEQFRYIDKVSSLDKELLQVSSKITGQLAENYPAHLGDIFEKLLPAGSICGAPKPKTVAIIKAAENYVRGYYTGICGYYKDGKVESGVMIRFIENIDGQLFYKSGGGITVSSNVDKEYQELIDKVYVPIHREHLHSRRKNQTLTTAQ